MPGRDIVFNLKVGSSAAATSELKEFASEVAKSQEKITKDSIVAQAKAVKEGLQKEAAERKKAAQDLKREQDRDIAHRQKQDAMVARAYLREHLKAIDD